MAFLSQATSSWRLASPSRLPFRSMLLTPRGGPWCFAPRAHQIPVYLMVFSTFLCRAFTAHGAVMVRDPLAIIAIDAPDGDRRAHHVCGHVARQTLVLRWDVALLDVAHQAVGILLETPLHQLVDDLRLERLAHHAQQMPLPRAMEQLIRQVMQVFPALSLLIIAPTGGDQMPMGMVVTIAPMGMDHHDVAPLEPLAPDLAIKIIQALHPTPHQGAQQDRGVVVEGRAEHRRDRQDDVPIDHSLVEHRAHLADPVIYVDFGAPQAQRGFTAHRHPMGALATLQATVFDVVGQAAGEVRMAFSPSPPPNRACHFHGTRLSSFLSIMVKNVSAIRISRTLASFHKETCFPLPLGFFLSSLPL